MSDWIVERRRDTAEQLHARSADLVDGAVDGGLRRAVERRILVLDATGPAIVLGRAEPDDHVDRGRAAAAGVAVVRRRSGGGAVLVGPGGTLWIDVVVPVDDPLWSPDVGRAMWWVGEAWAAALGDIGFPGATVWRGAFVANGWSDRVCFAGVGSGEVTVPGADGRAAKVVGVAQRRTRRGALFQCSALVRWQPRETLDVLALSDAGRRSGTAELADAAVGVGERAGALVEAVIRRVTSSTTGGMAARVEAHHGGDAPHGRQLP